MTSSAPSHTIASPTTPTPTGHDFSIFTALRYDPQLLSSAANTTASALTTPTPFYLLSHHRDRMLAAATHFSYPPAATAILHSLEAFTQRLQEAVDSYSGEVGPLKLKPALSRDGAFTVETSPTPEVPLWRLFPDALPGPTEPTEWQIVLDMQPTHPSSFTSFKTTEREIYESARRRVGIRSYAEPKEVIMWNEKLEAMEGSLTSIYVLRDGEWITPLVRSGGQQGTTRRWILEMGLAREGVVGTGELRKGAWVVVSNGVRGIYGARIM